MSDLPLFRVFVRFALSRFLRSFYPAGTWAAACKDGPGHPCPALAFRGHPCPRMVLDMHVQDPSSGDIHVPPHRAGSGWGFGHGCPRNLRPEHGCSGRSTVKHEGQPHAAPLSSFHSPPVILLYSRHSAPLPSFQPPPVILSGSEESSRLAIGSGDPSLRSG